MRVKVIAPNTHTIYVCRREVGVGGGGWAGSRVKCYLTFRLSRVAVLSCRLVVGGCFVAHALTVSTLWRTRTYDSCICLMQELSMVICLRL